MVKTLLSLQESESEVAQSCLTLCDPMDCSLPGSSVHGIFQARLLEWVAIAFSRRSFWPRNWTRVSDIVSRHFTVWATREVILLEVDCQSLLHLFGLVGFYLAPLSALGFPGGSEGKASAHNAGDPGSIPGLGRSLGEGNGNPLQYSCLENSMDGGTW